MNLRAEFLVWNKGSNGGWGDTGAMGGAASSGGVDNGTIKSKNMSVRANEKF